MSIRIISGFLKNRKIQVSKHSALRPTSERVREALFSILSSQIVGSSFLDACAGSGIIGLEALSRGAQSVSFYEKVRESHKILKSNLEHLGLQDHSGVELVRSDVKNVRKQFWDITFWDPPYKDDPLAWLEFAEKLTGKILIYEHSKRFSLPDTVGSCKRIDVRKYGDTKITIYQESP